MRFAARSIAVALSALAVLAGAALALSTEEVYYGNARRYENPVEINAKKVFMAIPAYKEIVDKQIDTTSAVYLGKLEEANKAFAAAVASYAQDNGYDLVCEEGRIKNAPNGTEDVIKLIVTPKGAAEKDAKGGAKSGEKGTEAAAKEEAKPAVTAEAAGEKAPEENVQADDGSKQKEDAADPDKKKSKRNRKGTDKNSSGENEKARGKAKEKEQPKK